MRGTPRLLAAAAAAVPLLLVLGASDLARRRGDASLSPVEQMKKDCVESNADVIGEAPTEGSKARPRPVDGANDACDVRVE